VRVSRQRIVWSSAVAAVLVVLVVVVVAVTRPSGTAATVGPAAGRLPVTASAQAPTAATSPQQLAPQALATQQLAALPEATTNAKLSNAPVDTGEAATDGLVVHNSATVAVFTAPNGTPFARLPSTQVGSDTWLPVIEQQPGWVRVLLPSRPNGAAGWIEASHVRSARTPYLVRVHLSRRTMEIFRDGRSLGSWRAGIGMPDTPTPAGRTFLLASIKDPSQSYSPVILPLGTHSSTLDTYGGGPGTVAIHTWPTADVYGAAVSHGCVRVPPDALRTMQTVPLGTIVLITDD
jgi:lipoprotein-anchoring transpeptidase ErfK/SrfK